MQSQLKIAIEVCALLIGYVYPFVAVLYGRDIWKTSKTIWLVLIVYFIAACLGIPLAGSYFSQEFGRKLAIAVPEPPIIVPILFFGWMCPLLAGLFALLVRHLTQRKRTPPVGN